MKKTNNDTPTSRLEQTRNERLHKVKQLRELGIDPYPATAKKDVSNNEIIENYEKLEGQTFTLAGRLISLRDHSHLVFGDLEDQSGKIQLYIRDEVLKPTDVKKQILGFEQLNLVDAGDFVQATGEITKTQRGEISLLVSELKMLSKSLRPLPNRHDAMSDPELVFRRRYVDLATNPERRAVFERKSKFWRVARQFFLDRGFIEVETPILELVTGGADARPFTTYHNALDQNFYLRISSELYQKRLIGGGFEKVFVLGPNFRNEGIDDEHLQEYYQLEYYQAYSDVNETIALTKELYKHLAQEVWGRTKFTYKGYTFDLADEWETIDYVKAIQEKFGIDVFTASFEDMYAIIKKHNPEIEFEPNRNRLVDNLWKIIRKQIAGPASLVNAPKFISPLAKSYFDTPHITQRFQPIIAGSEVGNAYSELNDPVDQLQRFLEQQNLRDAGDAEAQMLDIDFVEMLEFGMPPTSCIGFSERLFWMLEGVTAREGTLFPQMKPKLDPLTQQIYGLKKPKPKKKEETKLPKEKPSSTTILPSRSESQELLKSYVKNEALVHHCEMVAAAMEAYAQELKEDTELWYQAGLLHDLDWEMYPDEHPNKATQEILKNYPEKLKNAIASHAPDRTGKQPETLIEKYLFACDEISGLMHAISLMRPNGFADMEAKSVKKKLKDKSFAANVSRADIQRGVELIGKTPDEHISFLIEVFAKMK